MPNTLRKVESFMLKERSTKKTYTPTYNRIYLLSDSKGNYLKREQYAVGDIVDTSPVSYRTKKGRTTADGVAYLESQTRNLQGPGRGVVLFWHFTCDLSKLVMPERYLAQQLLEHLKPSFDRLEELHHTNNFDVGILECPPIFWHKWNKLKGDPNWEKANDSTMHEQVERVNDYIREVNGRLNYISPKFICDCMEFRKKKGQGPHRTSLSSDLFGDGVHPVG